MMETTKDHKWGRRAPLALLLTGLVNAALAEPASLTLDYTCVFPMIEEQPLSVHITTDLPASVAVGEVLDEIEVEAVSTVGEGAWNGLSFVGTRTLEGSARADVVLDAPSYNFPFSVPITLAKTELPEQISTFEVDAHGTAPGVSFRDAGEATLSVGDLVLSLSPRDHQDAPTGLGDFESECTVDPGQDQILHTFTVGDDGGGQWTMAVNGDARIGSASGQASMTGSLNAVLDSSDNSLVGTLDFSPTRGEFKIISLFNLITASADLEFQTVGEVRGTPSDDALTLHTTMKVMLPSVEIKTFGLPWTIGGGSSCGTREPVAIELKTSEDGRFTPDGGGVLEGTFRLPPVKNCGGFDGIINLLVGGESSIRLTLKPQG